MSKAPLNPAQPVRTASNTKTFVAVGVLRLWEQGALGLDSGITAHLPENFVAIIRKGGYEPESITIRHLLTHTSGLFDFSQSETFDRLCRANPKRHWTREEQLQGAMDWGKPYGPPGKVFSYSDTGYILLGEILEQKTKKSMGGALRELVDYKALGLSSTWLESVEPVPVGVPDRAHQYDGAYDTYGDDPSSDLYGGGGLVSTVHDLALFVRGVFTGKVYSKTNTLEMMLTTVAVSAVGPPAYGREQKAGTYRMGIRVNEVNGMTVYEHGGYWGTHAAYIPSLDLAVGVNVTQVEGHLQGALFTQALERISDWSAK
jgi:D-alanyl-D-alanine carboxypeptidase